MPGIAAVGWGLESVSKHVAAAQVWEPLRVGLEGVAGIDKTRYHPLIY